MTNQEKKALQTELEQIKHAHQGDPCWRRYQEIHQLLEDEQEAEDLHADSVNDRVREEGR